MSELTELLAAHIADWQSGWSMGSFGAVAEFVWDEGEAARQTTQGGPLERATARGGIRLDANALGAVVPIAYELPSPKPHRWSHALALCLPAERAASARRSVLTEIGPDRDAIRSEDRDAVLFDLGLSLPQADFCIRTADPDLLAVLRANAGLAVFDPASTTMPAVLKAHPHRIAVTAIGRVEVYQKIGGPDTGGVSPPGPHTHLLPQIMKSGRTHSANTPIPEGLVPLGSLHPGNPVSGPLGEEREFDPALHEQFQALLARYGVPQLLSVKNEVIAALAAGADASALREPENRSARAVFRLALRQEARRAAFLGDGRLAAIVAAWRTVHDANALDDSEASSPEAEGGV